MNRRSDCPLLPIGSRIVVLREEAEKQSKGGIFIPDTAQKKSRIGTVVAIGPGDTVDGDPNNRRYAMDISVGQNVAIDLYGGNEVELDGKTYVVVKQADVLAVVAK